MRKEVESKMKKEIQLEDDEYINPKDNLIWCKKCNTPRQIRKIFGPSTLTPKIKCKCQAEEARRQAALNEKAERKKRILQMKQAGLGWKDLWKMTYEADDGHNPNLMARIKNYTVSLEDSPRLGVLFWGPPGRGKTYLAACIINDLLEKEVPAGMFSFRQLITEISGMSLPNRTEYLDDLFRKKALCLDDFSLKCYLKYSENVIMDIIDRIDRCGFPVILTTNYTMSELEHPKTELEEYAFRIILNRTVQIKVDGLNMKDIKNQEHYQQVQRQCMGKMYEPEPGSSDQQAHLN